MAAPIIFPQVFPEEPISIPHSTQMCDMLTCSSCLFSRVHVFVYVYLRWVFLHPVLRFLRSLLFPLPCTLCFPLTELWFVISLLCHSEIQALRGLTSLLADVSHCFVILLNSFLLTSFKNISIIRTGNIWLQELL